MNLVAIGALISPEDLRASQVLSQETPVLRVGACSARKPKPASRT